MEEEQNPGVSQEMIEASQVRITVACPELAVQGGEEWLLAVYHPEVWWQILYGMWAEEQDDHGFGPKYQKDKASIHWDIKAQTKLKGKKITLNPIGKSLFLDAQPYLVIIKRLSE